MSRNLVLVFLLATGLVLAGCNTVRGVGQDLESAANEVDSET